MIFIWRNGVTCPYQITCANSSELEFVSSCKYLGLWLDSTHSFISHISNLQAKVKARLRYFNCKEASFTYSAKNSLVKMTILSLFDYGDVIYKMAPKCALNRLFILFHSAIHFVNGAPFSTHHCELYKLICWSSLHSIWLNHWYLIKSPNREGAAIPLQPPATFSKWLPFKVQQYH